MQWDNAGNLKERKNLASGGKTEVFGYDELNRLQTVALNGTATLNMDYDDAGGNTGNIQYKSDFGTYTYGQWGAGPRQVTQVSGAESMTYHYDANGNIDCRGWNAVAQSCTPTSTADELQWTSFNLPKRIERGSDYSVIDYGPDRQRAKEVRSADGLYTTNLIVGPHFEKMVTTGFTRIRNNVFVDGQMVYFQVEDEIAGDGHSGTSYPTYAYYVHRDHQGSVDELTLAWGTTGAPVPYSYDAFGKRREPDWTADTDHSQLYATFHMSTRGYTGHEHLDHVGMIHMKGRVQDPVLGRMTSRDPYLGDIANPETLNRYAYVGNNPLSHIDPTGFCRAQVNCVSTNDGSPPQCSVSYENCERQWAELSAETFRAYDRQLEVPGGPKADRPIDGSDISYPSGLVVRDGPVGLLSPQSGVNVQGASIVGGVARLAAWLRALRAARAGAEAEKQVLRATDKQIGRKFGEHRDPNRPGYRTHDEYRQRANEIVNDPNARITRYPQGSSQFPGETHYQVGNDLLRLDPSGTFRSLYPVK